MNEKKIIQIVNSNLEKLLGEWYGRITPPSIQNWLFLLILVVFKMQHCSKTKRGLFAQFSILCVPSVLKKVCFLTERKFPPKAKAPALPKT